MVRQQSSEQFSNPFPTLASLFIFLIISISAASFHKKKLFTNFKPLFQTFPTIGRMQLNALDFSGFSLREVSC